MRKTKVIKDFDYYIDEYMYYCRSRKLRPKTMNSYEQTLHLFARWCADEEGIIAPNEVTEATIRKYICSLQERGKYTFCSNDRSKKYNYPERRKDYRREISITTINNYIRNLKAFYGWFSYDANTKNPMERVKQLHNERTAQEYLTDEELLKLCRSFDKSYYVEHRDYTIIMLLLDTGMRIGECLKIELKDLDMKERVITLPAEHTKGRKTRCVFFSVKTQRVLQKWLRFKDRYSESNLLFHVKAGSPLEVRCFEKNLRNYLARAGIEKAYSPHALRNNFAKRALMAGMDIYTLSRILGHSSVTVTEKAYLDLSDRDLRQRYQCFSPLEQMWG